MTLPVLDVPVGVLDWELFLPERYSAKPTAGNVLPAHLLDRAGIGTIVISGLGSGSAGGTGVGIGAALGARAGALLSSAGPGQILGRVTDPTGAPIPGATIAAAVDGKETLSAVTDNDGMYVVHGVPPGTVTVASELAGFNAGRRTFEFDGRPRRLDFRMEIGATSETVTVMADAPVINTASAGRAEVNEPKARPDRDAASEQVAPSQNVVNLQRRVAGVLPVRVDVPRAGTQYRFVRPLVLDDETTVSFKYSTR
jgi:hypothetical protein